MKKIRELPNAEIHLKDIESKSNYKINPTLLNNFRFRYGASPVQLPSTNISVLRSTGTQKILVLLIDIMDDNNQYMGSTFESATSIQNKFFGPANSTTAPFDSLQQYYKRASYNKLNITGNVLGWYPSGIKRSSIPNEPDNQSTSKREDLVKAALRYYDGLGHDFSQYDNDNNGTIDYIVVVWGGKMDSTVQTSQFWWGYFVGWSDSNFLIDNKRLVKYSWQGTRFDSQPSFNIIVPIHETGHALGLPDLYDYDNAVGTTGGVGGLDMMHGNMGDFNCFSKWLLDWLTPTIYSSGTNDISLSASGTSPDCAVIKRNMTTSNIFSEFFVLQNRHKVGNDIDINMPTNGAILWHVDATLGGNDGTGFLYNNSYTDRKFIALEQADGLGQIELGYGVDAGDYYTLGKTFTPTSTPNSKFYGNIDSGISITNISNPGTTMSFRVSFSGTPTSPTLSKLSSTTSSINIGWSAVSGSTYYQLYRGGAQVGGNITSTSYNDTALAAGTTYSYTAKACNTSGCSALSTAFSASTNSSSTIPSAPSLSKLSATTSSINIGWSAVSGATYYQLYRGGSQVGGNITSTSYNDTGLAAGTTYSYTAKACNTSGCSALSTIFNASTNSSSTIPSAPSLSKLSATTSSINIGWSAVSGATSYALYRGGTQIGGSITSTSYNDTGLAAGTTYSYTAKACSRAGCSTLSSVFNASTNSSSTIPSTPSLSKLSATTSSINIGWSAISSATYYQLYRGGAQVGGNITSTSYNDTGLAAGTTYSYSAKACNTAGCSVLSSAFNAATNSASTASTNIVRETWEYVDAGAIGTLERRFNSTNWIEYKGSYFYSFVERARTSSYIEIFDSTRNIALKLNFDGTGQWQTAWNPWVSGSFTRRSSWEYSSNGSIGNFRKIADGTNNWIEYGISSNFNWKETSRTTNYVELLDSSRNMKARLYADRGELSTNNGSTWFYWTAGNWSTRALWKYIDGSNQGYFEKGTGTAWSEYSGGKVRYNWSETASTTTYVEFLDSSRNMKMRLFSDHGEYSVNNGSTWTRWVNGAWN